MRKLTLTAGALAIALTMTACKGKDEAPATDDAAKTEAIEGAEAAATADAALVTEAQKTAAVVVSDAWARETATDAVAGGAFMTITNGTAKDDVLVSATAKFAGKVEMHESKMDNNVMVMRPVEGGIPLKAGSVTRLAPGGLHVMFMDLKGPLRAGKEVEVTLTFKEAGEQTVKLPVKSMAEADAMGGMAHGKDGTHE